MKKNHKPAKNPYNFAWFHFGPAVRIANMSGGRKSRKAVVIAVHRSCFSTWLDHMHEWSLCDQLFFRLVRARRAAKNLFTTKAVRPRLSEEG